MTSSAESDLRAIIAASRELARMVGALEQRLALEGRILTPAQYATLAQELGAVGGAGAVVLLGDLRRDAGMRES